MGHQSGSRRPRGSRRPAAALTGLATLVLLLAGCGPTSAPATSGLTPARTVRPTPVPTAATRTPIAAPIGTSVRPRCPAPATVPPVPVAVLSDGATSIEAVVGPGVIRVCGAIIPVQGPGAPPAETVLAPGSAAISLPAGWGIVRWEALATDLPHLVRLPAGSGQPAGRPSEIRGAIGLWSGERYLLDVSIEAVSGDGTTVVSVTYTFGIRVP